MVLHRRITSADMTSTSRLLRLLSLLQTRRDWPGALLAERLEISHRTVRRDVDRLREMGYSIRATMGPDGGYRLDAGSELPPLLFDDDQVIALAVALQAATTAGAGIEEAAVRALTTVRQVMPVTAATSPGRLEFTAIPSRPECVPTPRVADVCAHRSPPPSAPARCCASTTPAAGARDAPRVRRAARGAASPGHLRRALVSRRVGPRSATIGASSVRTASSPRTPTGPRFIPRQIPGGDVAEYVSARFKGSSAINRGPAAERSSWAGPRASAPVRRRRDRGGLGADRCSLEAGSWSWVALAASLSRFDSTSR